MNHHKSFKKLITFSIFSLLFFSVVLVDLSSNRINIQSLFGREARAAGSYLPKGVYALVSKNNSVSVAILNNPNVSGLQIRMSWDQIEPTNNNFNWTYFDNIISQAKAVNKKVSITIDRGLVADGLPSWLSSALFTCSDATQGPIPWDLTYKTEWTELWTAITRRYENETAVSMYHIGGIYSWRTVDWDSCDATPADVNNWLSQGYQIEKIKNFALELFSALTRETKKPLVLPIAGIMNNSGSINTDSNTNNYIIKPLFDLYGPNVSIPQFGIMRTMFKSSTPDPLGIWNTNSLGGQFGTLYNWRPNITGQRALPVPVNLQELEALIDISLHYEIQFMELGTAQILMSGAGNLIQCYNNSLGVPNTHCGPPHPDTTAPTLSFGSPSGTLSARTTQTTLSVTTNENATCKYGTTIGTAYSSIVNTFTTTGGLSHSQTITGLTNGNSYNYYVRCSDAVGNANTTDYTISFLVNQIALDPTSLKGIYVIYNAQPTGNFTGWAGSTLINPDIEGYAMKFRWSDLQPTPTGYNWDWMISTIKTAAANNKKVLLHAQTVWQAPEWLYNPPYNVTKFLYKDGVLQPNGSRILQDAQIPLPWDTVYLAQTKTFLSALKSRLTQRGGVNDLTDAEYNTIVKINVANPGGVRDTFDLPTGKDDPLQTGAIDTRVGANYVHDYDYEWLNGNYNPARGAISINPVITTNIYSDTKLFNASKEIADHTVATFPDKFIGRTVFMQSSSLAKTTLENFITYLTRDSAYKDRIVLSVLALSANNIKENTEGEKRYEYLESSRLKFGTLIGFEMLSGSDNPNFNKDNLPYSLRQALINGIDRGGDWIQIYIKDAKDSTLWEDIKYAKNLLKNLSPDETEPTDVNGLSAAPRVNPRELKIDFLSPGDDYDAKTSQPAGEVKSYIVKYSERPITTSSDFDSATTYSQNWIPTRAGRAEGDETRIGPANDLYTYSKVLTGLTPGQLYYIAIKAKDDMGKISTGFVAGSGRASGVLSTDTIPPTGTVSINSGASITNSTTATLTLSATDTASGMGAGAEMQFSNDNLVWSTAEAYAVTKAWTLSTGDGIKTVYVKYKDVADNWMITAVSDIIILDTTNNNATLISRGPGGGGLLIGIAIDPNDADTVYTVLDVGGIKKSMDGGKSWESIGYDIKDISDNMEQILVSPHNSGTLLATARGPRNDVNNEGHIYVSKDYGRSWNNAFIHTKPISAIAFDPVSSSVMYAGSGDQRGLFGRANGWQYTTSDGKLWKSTNSGITWTEYSTVVANGHILTIAIDPNNSNVIYVATNKGLFKSNNGGNTWNQLTSGLPHSCMRDILLDPNNSAVVWVTMCSYRDLSNLGLTTAWEGGIYRSADGGATFSPKNSGLRQILNVSDETKTDEYWDLAIYPTNSAILYVVNKARNGQVYKTMDAGNSWNVVADVNPDINVTHGWQTNNADWRPLNIVIAKSNPNILYFTTAMNGQIYKSVDTGTTWIQSYTTQVSATWQTNGLELMGGTALLEDRTNPNHILVGYGDHGVFRSINAGNTWTWALNTNDVNRIIQHPTATGVFYAATGFSTGAGGPMAGNLYSSADGGVNWILIGGGSTNKNGLIGGWIFDLAINPSTPAIMYAISQQTTTGGVFKTIDGGQSWTRVGLNGLDVRALAIDPTNPNKIYVGVDNGGIYRSIDSGVNWVRIDVNANTLGEIWRLVFNGSDMLLAADDASGSDGGIWKSIDGGISWTRIFNLSRARGIAINGAVMYVNSFGNGMYASSNAGSSWQRKDDLFPTATFFNVIITPTGRIFAGARGHGWLELLSLSDTTSPIISAISASNITQTSATITWTTDEMATHQVEYGLSSAYGSITPVNSTLMTNHTQSLSALSVGTLYHYRVRSKDGSDNEAISTDNTFTTLVSATLDTTAPAQTTDLTANNITQTSVDLMTWTAAGDDGNVGMAFEFDIRYTTGELSENTWNNGGIVKATGEPTPKIAGSLMNYTLVGLTPNTTYKVALKTLDEVPNQSPISNIILFTTLKEPPPPPTGGGGGGGGGGGSIPPPIPDITPPSQPQGFKAQGADKQINLSWQNPKDNDFVRSVIIRSEAPILASISAQDAIKNNKVIYEGDKQEYTDINLDNAKTYHYAIFAYDKKPNYTTALTLQAKPEASKVSINVARTKLTYNLGTVTLRNGSRGEPVKELQKLLNQLLNLNLTVDGKLGPKTIIVIKQWQRDHQLKVDGLVGPKTKIAMNREAELN